MRRGSCAILGFITLSVWLLSAAAPAGGEGDVEEAAARFTQAERAYRRKEFRDAAEGFEASHQLAPHGAALYNAGMAWLEADERGRAADAFAGARKVGGMDERQDELCLAKLRDLRAVLGRVAIGAPRGSTVSLAHARGRDAPTLVHVEPGDYEVRVELPTGRQLDRLVHVEAGELRTIAFDAPAEQAAAPVESSDTSDTGEGPSALPVAGWVMVGTGVAAAAVAIGLGVAALDARDEFDASGYVDGDAHARADQLRTATNVCWVLAGVTAATGAVLLIVAYSGGDEGDEPQGTDDTDEEPDDSSSVALGLGLGSVWLTGTW
ncbi:MAG: hypothetical protein JRI23_18285 [Deltaproteobacteria bacterium]|jgi:hypothetical protein|nr:hypothetical protein [Deltaproteobacteria bacterium]MBW2533807.1 hypothetical protein [Deltaproteobacteria bacterium]